VSETAASRSEARSEGLRVEHLGHSFGARRVVDDVSFTIPNGAVHCLVGPSGCGKTTTLRLIAGLERVQTGRIWISGRKMADPALSVPPERRRVGLMFQDFALFPHLRVAENVGFGLTGLDRRARETRVTELLGRVNMLSHARDYPHTLSGGEQQRVALARALAPEPELMLLDEAFSALDTTLRAQVREDTLGVLRETGTATLLVTHDAEEAVRSGDCIHAMQNGRIVQSGTPSELYARPVNRFVAGFFGPVNRYPGTVHHGHVRTPVGDIPAERFEESAPVDVILRPEGVRLRSADGGPPPETPMLHGRVISRRDLGPVHLVWLGLPDGSVVRVRQGGAVDAAVGDEVEIELDRRHVFVYAAEA
jgi:iron(III) transport system ATP-binding protein